ncbi:Uncharacterised protein [Sporosarcina pasteurii]|uniref:Uncharacterized protein n=1 Tax=Sporosarcina pasteurii TaxID=1474 RepID=A0A380CDS9_SPOPA|nr:Uncharacterised protein [Sporosarcina pasteurii]
MILFNMFGNQLDSGRYDCIEKSQLIRFFGKAEIFIYSGLKIFTYSIK